MSKQEITTTIYQFLKRRRQRRNKTTITNMKSKDKTKQDNLFTVTLGNPDIATVQRRKEHSIR